MEKENKDRCTYCGGKTKDNRLICETCYDKLILIRRLRKIVFDIKRQAEEDRHDSGRSEGTAASVSTHLQ